MLSFWDYFHGEPHPVPLTIVADKLSITDETLRDALRQFEKSGNWGAPTFTWAYELDGPNRLVIQRYKGYPPSIFSGRTWGSTYRRHDNTPLFHIYKEGY